MIKHGVVGLTKYLSTYWATQQIKVNALSQLCIASTAKNILNNLKKLIPMNRLAKNSIRCHKVLVLMLQTI